MYDFDVADEGNRLAPLGLSEAAADVYFRLLQGPVGTDSAQLLAELRQANLVDIVDGEVVVYSAAHRLRERADEFFAAAEAAFGAALDLERAALDAPCAVTVIAAPEQLRRAHRRIVSSAQLTLRAFDCAPYLDDPPSLAEGQPASLSTGVKHRVVYDVEVLQEPARRQVMLDAVALGEDARVVRSLPFRMLVADEAHVLVFRSESGSGDIIGLWLDDTLLVSLMCELFDSIWNSAVSFDTLHTEDLSELDGKTYRLLALLGMGLTDESIAQQLGVSVRTVSRRINGLARLLGVRSRFQLGAAAQRCGWLSGDV